MGVSERLLAFRLVGDDYEQQPLGTDGGIDSPALGLRLVPDGPKLRLFNRQTGVEILTGLDKSQALEEERRRREDESRQLEEERRRAEALAAEVERLRALLGQGEAAPAGDQGDSD